MMGHTQIQQAKSAFNRNDAVLAQWKSGDGLLAGLLARDTRLARAAEWMALRVSWSDSATERGMHALEILAHAGSIARITPHHHTVLSCSNPSKKYNVRQKRRRWSCDCPDHTHRKAQCKHILATIYHVVEREEASLGICGTPADQGAGARRDEQPDTHIEEVDEFPKKCIVCQTSHIIKWGSTGEGESRRPRYKCKNPECGCTFVYRGGFERMRKPVWAILRAFNDFFKGHTPEDIVDTLENAGCEVDRSSIYKWLAKFIPISHEYLRYKPIRTGERLAADEVRLSGNDDEEDTKEPTKTGTTSSPGAADDKDEKDAKESATADAQAKKPNKEWYLFSTTDISTRFCTAFEMADHKDGFNATNLLKESKRRTGKVPAEFVTDALPSYDVAHLEEFAAKNPLDKHSVHICNASLNNKKKNNNFQERFNGTFREFQRPRRGIPNPHSPMITGFFVYYNFVRPHSSLNKRTPAEAAGIIIHGADKWKTILGNASLAARARRVVP